MSTNSKQAILLIDLQNDFFPGGALGVPDGDDVLEPINALLEQHPDAPVFATRDWHPEKTKHFKELGGAWPPHCVQDTPGAAFHAKLRLPEGASLYFKGTNPDDDGGYSGFEARNVQTNSLLAEDLRSAGVDTLIVAGLATDYCVKASVLDGIENGFKVQVFEAGIRAVNIEPEDGQKALDEMQKVGATLF